MVGNKFYIIDIVQVRMVFPGQNIQSNPVDKIMLRWLSRSGEVALSFLSSLIYFPRS